MKETDPSPSARLEALRSAVAALLPEKESLPPSGKEAERLISLRRAALHLGRLPLSVKEQETERYQKAAALREQAASVLALLGEHASTEVPLAIERAVAHWDQAGNLCLLSDAGKAQALSLHKSAHGLLDEVLGAKQRTRGLCALLLAVAETMLAVDAACSLLRGMEMRFVILLREKLRLEGEGADARAVLLPGPGGSPFIDVGGALLEMAWAFGREKGARA